MNNDQTLRGIQDLFGSSASSHCSVCGRSLSDPVSVSRGIGPVCARRVGYYREPMGDFADGFLFEPPISEAVVVERIDGRTYTNVPHAVTHHSPTGYEWGYGGSGPADLALNIMEIYLAKMGLHSDVKIKCFDGVCDRRAWDLHQDFKWQFIGRLDRAGGVIAGDDIRQWITEQLKAQEPTEAEYFDALMESENSITDPNF